MKHITYIINFILLLSLSLHSSFSYSSINNEGFADLVEELIPSVVSISTSQTINKQDSNLDNIFKDKGLNEYFKGLPELLEKFYGVNPMPEKAHSLGSGFITDKRGYIVTNYHVIENSEEISIIFSDDSTAKARVIGKDIKTDIALLKVDISKNLPYTKWGNSDKARIGDWVIAIGNPFGLGSSVSSGIISGRARSINIGHFDDFIQTDAAINRGNSGGPLFNTQGEVIGINSAIFSPSGGNVGVGFSVPSSLAEPVINQLKNYGETRRGWLGVKIQQVTPEIANNLGLDKPKGALIIDVIANAPAEKSGLRSGDIILSFNNQDILLMRKLPRIVAETKINSKVPIKIWRNNKEKTLIVKVAKLEEEIKKEPSLISKQVPKNKEQKLEVLGVELSSIDDNLRRKYQINKNITKGLVITKLLKNSNQNKLIPGDVIISANQKEIDSLLEFVKIIENTNNTILLLIIRNNEKQFIVIEKNSSK